MPSRFDRYRMKDGQTRLGEAFFNAVFKDIDLRLVGLEALNLSWEQAVRTVTDYGLARVNEVVEPTLVDATQKAADVENKRQAAIASLAAMQTAIAGFETNAAADLEDWKAAKLAALQAWQDSLAGALPTINTRLSDLEAIPSFSVVSYDNRATLRDGNPAQHQKALVEGLGLFVFYVESTEPDDDESCFATANGRWLLEAAHWDLVDAWQLPDADYREEFYERWPGQVLFGSGYSAIASLAGLSQASFTGTINGAEPGDRVLATPPTALPAHCAWFAMVTSTNTITVYLNNPSAGTAYLTPGTWQLTVFKNT